MNSRKELNKNELYKQKNVEFINEPRKWLMYKLRKERENETSTGRYLLTDNVAIKKTKTLSSEYYCNDIFLW